MITASQTPPLLCSEPAPGETQVLKPLHILPLPQPPAYWPPCCASVSLPWALHLLLPRTAMLSPQISTWLNSSFHSGLCSKVTLSERSFLSPFLKTTSYPPGRARCLLWAPEGPRLLHSSPAHSGLSLSGDLVCVIHWTVSPGGQGWALSLPAVSLAPPSMGQAQGRHSDNRGSESFHKCLLSPPWLPGPN